MASAIILDLDGTLWNSRPFYAATAARSATARRQAAAELASGASSAKLLKSAGIDAAALQRRCVSETKVALYPGALATIGALRNAGLPLGIVTNLPEWIVTPMLAGHDLTGCFESIVTWGRTKRRKPHPDPLLLCCEELDIGADTDCWYIGDTASDAQAASTAGLSFAWASWGYGGTAPTGSVELTTFNDIAEL
jgi:HAD superfamily hydrolase (TIGR01549 family)